MQKLPKIAKQAKNGKHGKVPKNAETARNGQKVEEWALFHLDPDEIFKLLHILNRLVQTLSER